MKNFRNMPESDEDSTPVSAMIDIVFLLLIYFILTQRPLIEESLLDFSPGLRGSTGSVAQMPEDFITVELENDSGSCVFNGQAVNAEQLAKLLHSTGQRNKQTKLIVFCADDVAHVRLVEVLDICRRSGLSDVNVLAK